MKVKVFTCAVHASTCLCSPWVCSSPGLRWRGLLLPYPHIISLSHPFRCRRPLPTLNQFTKTFWRWRGGPARKSRHAGASIVVVVVEVSTMRSYNRGHHLSVRPHADFYYVCMLLSWETVDKKIWMCHLQRWAPGNGYDNKGFRWNSITVIVHFVASISLALKYVAIQFRVPSHGHFIITQVAVKLVCLDLICICLYDIQRFTCEPRSSVSGAVPFRYSLCMWAFSGSTCRQITGQTCMLWEKEQRQNTVLVHGHSKVPRQAEKNGSGHHDPLCQRNQLYLHS